MASAIPSRQVSGPTAIARSPTRADKVGQSDDHISDCPGCGCANAGSKTRLKDSGDRHNNRRQPPAAPDDCGTDSADLRRKRSSTMPSDVLGCDVSGIGLVLPGGRGNGACRMADAADLLTTQGDVRLGSAAEGACAGTGETTPPSSSMAPLAGDVTLPKCGDVANSSLLDGRYRAPEMPPPPPPPLPQPPPHAQRITREVATPLDQVLPEDDARGFRPGGREHAGKRRVCSLQGVETTLQGVLESMKGGLPVDSPSLGVNGMFRTDADNTGECTKHGFFYDMTTMGAPPPPSPSANTRNPPVGRRTQDNRRPPPASLRSHLRDAAGVRKAHDLEHALPNSGKRDAGVATSSDKVHPVAGPGGFDYDGHHQSVRRNIDGLFEARRTWGHRQRIEWDNTEGDGEGGEEEAVTERVIELSRGIALRCLHLEQECLRRGRTQARLFQEQLRGVRQVTAIVLKYMEMFSRT